jgi:hypothetical protein
MTEVSVNPPTPSRTSPTSATLPEALLYPCQVTSTRNMYALHPSLMFFGTKLYTRSQNILSYPSLPPPCQSRTVQPIPTSAAKSRS